MTPDEFRRQAHALVEWMADYLADATAHRVVPTVSPGDITAQLPANPPDQAEPFDAILADFQRVIVPGMTHWNHPGWFAYFPGNNSPPSVLAEMLTATLGAQCMSWQTSPAATELEQVTLDWLRGMIGLPPDFTGVIQDTASTATLVALISARERAARRASNGSGPGPAGRALAVYASGEAHSSVAKGAKLAGYGSAMLRSIRVDDRFAMRPEALREAIEADLAAGIQPACVIATIGTTSSTAIDPVPAIAAICRQHGAWLHVDAAYAGSAAILPECRAHFDGIDLADSFVFNPHKWLLTNFDCSAYFVRDVDTLLSTFGATPEYLRTPHDARVTNYRDWGIQLGRRFRALKLWFVIRSYGVDGLRAMLRKHVALAADFRSWVESEPGFEVMAPSPFGLVCFRHVPGGMAGEAVLEAHNREVLDRVNRSGTVYLTHTSLGGRFALRLVVGQWRTERADVERAWALIRNASGETRFSR
ncbi:MAG TPA: pyridoxal-dependent decarboxylase [Gemmatimonadales bacterium]|nr:pyridoxal-dependent decarboxylase [Gemmatimonadales bacterium]